MRQRAILSVALLFAVAPTVYAQTYKVIYNFGIKSGEPLNPSAPGIIAQSRGGNLFSAAGGAAFKITTGGNLTVLNNDTVTSSGLTLGTDGQYYGGMPNGDYLSPYGSIFKMKQGGSLTTLYGFAPETPASGCPLSAPIESEGGDFYGDTQGCGYRYPDGSIYKITKDGKFTLLHTFDGYDGEGPVGPLVQGTDDYFYGTTQYGGTSDQGTIFRISPSGDFQVLFNFDGRIGAYPYAGLIQANDGNFYGTASGGGPNDSQVCGSVFKMTPAGHVTVLHYFDNFDGCQPWAGLVQATDGNLYGTTYLGVNGISVIFRASLAGHFTVLHSFPDESAADGCCSQSAMMQHTNGLLYGMTSIGGTVGNGTFFSMDMGLKPFVTYLPVYGRVGATVEILGQGFSKDSTVAFHGVRASFTVVYPTYLKAVVPRGATSGPITVTTANGTLTSNKVFVVHRN